MPATRVPAKFMFALLLLLPAVCSAQYLAESFTEPFRRIDIAPAELGTIKEVLVHEGDPVTRGQIVAKLDHDYLLVSLESARANREAQGKLSAAIAERDMRNTRAERLTLLREKGHASQEEVSRAEADLAVAQANLTIAREQQILDALECKRLEAMLERRILRSPIDGVVLRVHRDEHEFVSTTSSAVVTVVQLDKLRVVFSLPTAQAAQLAVGREMRLQFPESNQTTKGIVETISPVTDPESGTVRVRVLIDNSRALYRCGVKCTLLN